MGSARGPLIFGKFTTRMPLPQLLEGESSTELMWQRMLLLITWTPQACKPTAFGALFAGFGPLFYILLASRYA